jgi:thymidylate synthase
MILESEDSIVNDAPYTIEYPCTIAYSFYVERGRLCSTTIMRSNNVCSVIGLDVYLAVNLLKKISELTEIPVGTYTHFMVDGHVIESEIQRAKNYISMEL